MEDSFLEVMQLFLMQQQIQQEQLEATSSIFDTVTFWIIAAMLLPVVIKFAFVAIALNSMKNNFSGGGNFKPGPFGALGPLFGVPAVIPKTENEIERERVHSFRKWGVILSFFCFIGGMILFFMGVSGNTGIELVEVKITDAAPGTILFVFGFLIWRGTHKSN